MGPETILALDLQNLPDVWGEGALFAYSGLDGETNTASSFVASLHDQYFSLLFHTPEQVMLYMGGEEDSDTLIATSDVLFADTRKGYMLASWWAWHTLVGTSPYQIVLTPITVTGLHTRGITVDPSGAAIALATNRELFAVSYGATWAEASRRAEMALAVDPYRTALQRLTDKQMLPDHPEREKDRLMKKCFSVMKVNTLSGEGRFHQFWSTPDRVPQQHLMQWDSVFHALGMLHINPRMAWYFIKSVFDTQQEDGLIPHMTGPGGEHSKIGHPPVLGWGVWEVYERLDDKLILHDALPILEKYLNWHFNQRDLDRDGLLEWHRGDAVGMEGSPRFDHHDRLEVLDLNVFTALDMSYVAMLLYEMGRTTQAAEWQSRSSLLSAQVHRYMWDEEDGFYYDRDMDGNFVKVRAVSGFFPLLLDDIPPEHVERLVGWLKDPQHFNAPFPVPSIALSAPQSSGDMWRGPTWINSNFLIITGLRRHGQHEVADWLREKTLFHVQKYYEEYGTVFEFYDSRDEEAPVDLGRLGPASKPYNLRHKVDAIRDFHWTAALTFSLLTEDIPERPRLGLPLPSL
ncbi:MAG: hypothetical protein GYB68_11865 [Chloroflexi bacterium]|nr:hypothetical protein [Chloroflexota bacterium]